MSRTRKEDRKVRITIRAYESTIEKIKTNGSSLQKEWDNAVEKKYNPEKYKEKENGKDEKT